MMNKKGFAFVETIITVVVLMASLLVLYGSYNAILSDEKTRLYYDDPAFIYYTNYVKDFLEEHGDLETIKKDSFKKNYVVALGVGFEGLFANSEDYASLESIVQDFKINQMVLVKKSIFTECFETTKNCTNSINYLSAKMQKYINSISDMDYDYFLVIEYSVKLNDNNEYTKCTPMIDRNCKTYYASVGINNRSLANFIKKEYGGVQGNNGIYYHDSTLTNGAKDYSYRYAGANPNNYVCFGSDAETCPDTNLYRIIGLFEGRVKLIKATSIGKMAWDTGDSNTWSTSSLNAYLNGTYLTSLGAYTDKIDVISWKVLGTTWKDASLQVPTVAYQNEIVNPPASTTSTTGEVEYGSKIGLMYVTDYEFAASPSAWTLLGYSTDSTKDYRAATNINWMYSSLYEWTISRYSGTSDASITIYSTGYVRGNNYGKVTTLLEVRPTFYLNPSVIYKWGSGSKTDPIRLS